MANPDKPPPRTLVEHIDELESLLGDQVPGRDTDADPQGEARIPILDEVVEPQDVPARSDPEAALEPRQLVEISRRLQQRIDRELNELADVIRNVVKRCIQEELRSGLPPVSRKSQATSDKPQE